MLKQNDFGFKVVGICPDCLAEMCNGRFEKYWKPGTSETTAVCGKCNAALIPKLKVVSFTELNIVAQVELMPDESFDRTLKQVAKHEYLRSEYWFRENRPCWYWNGLYRHPNMRAAIEAGCEMHGISPPFRPRKKKYGHMRIYRPRARTPM